MREELLKKTNKELQEIAKENGFTNVLRLKKSDLIDLILKNENKIKENENENKNKKNIIKNEKVFVSSETLKQKEEKK